MKKLMLALLISSVYLYDARLTHYSSSGFLTSESEETDSGEEAQQCGMIMSPDNSQFKIRKRITIGGTDSKYTEFPWMVALFAPRKKRKQCTLGDKGCWYFKCGASLISSKAVLTAAICVHSYRHKKLKTRAGDWNLDTLEEPQPYQERYVHKTVIHERFHYSSKSRNLRYDVALLIVESPYTSADNIAFICLPPPDLDVASAKCKAAGWGVQTHGAHGHQKLLQVVDMDYVDHDRCEKSLRRMWRSDVTLHDSFTCAGGVKGKDTCQGDGGSPLMCISEDHYYARGLTSWGIGCGNADIPGVYTDVVKVRRWIDQKMEDNGLNTDTYTHIAYRK